MKQKYLFVTDNLDFVSIFRYCIYIWLTVGYLGYIQSHHFLNSPAFWSSLIAVMLTLYYTHTLRAPQMEALNRPTGNMTNYTPPDPMLAVCCHPRWACWQPGWLQIWLYGYKNHPREAFRWESNKLLYRGNCNGSCLVSCLMWWLLLVCDPQASWLCLLDSSMVGNDSLAFDFLPPESNFCLSSSVMWQPHGNPSDHFSNLLWPWFGYLCFQRFHGQQWFMCVFGGLVLVWGAGLVFRVYILVVYPK